MLQLSCLSFRFFHVFSDFWNCRLRSWLCPLPSWHGWAQYETFAKLQGFTQRLLKMPAHGNPQGANVAMKFNIVQQCECKRVNFLQLFRNVYFWDDFYELWSHIGHIGHAFITMPLSPPCTFSADTGEPIDFNRLSSGGSRPARPRPPTDLWWHTTLNGTDQYRVLVSMFTGFHSSICHRFSQF